MKTSSRSLGLLILVPRNFSTRASNPELFFGDELESVRYFNPQSQISRDKIDQVDISPGGEVGLLRHIKGSGRTTLLEHLPEDSILLFCDPDSIEEMAAQKVMEVPPGDQFHVEWATLCNRMDERNLSRIELYELDSEASDAVSYTHLTLPTKA